MFLHFGVDVFIVCSAVFVWMLNSDVYLPSTRLQPAEFWEQQLLKTGLSSAHEAPVSNRQRQTDLLHTSFLCVDGFLSYPP